MNRAIHCMIRLRRFYSVKSPFQLASPLKALVPDRPFKSQTNCQKVASQIRIDGDTIALLERLSLVDCANKKGIETLEAAIEFADQIQQVDTLGVEPLITVLEDLPLRLRDDEVNDGNCKRDILVNSLITEEDYFVAPPGNIPRESREDPLFENEWKDNDFEGTFRLAKRMCLDRLPFGIAEIIQNKKAANEEQFFEHYVERMNSKDIDFETYFGNEESLTLKCTVFTTPTNSVPFFHQWQRDRRIWWRKFSPNPGRYSITDIKTDENNTQSVQIMAKYPWKSHIVESLALHPVTKYTNEADKFKDGKKVVYGSSITSTIHLNTLFLNTICDAYDEPEYKGNKRVLLRFHRKIAPYSVSFAIAGGGVASTLHELNDLALLLTKQLRSNHVSTFFLPSCTKLSLEAQFRQYDELGVPYNIILKEKTLKDGLVFLRNRDTTLKEQVHVSELVAYVEKLFKYY